MSSPWKQLFKDTISERNHSTCMRCWETNTTMEQRDTLVSQSADDQRRLAVLIDADNAQPSVIEGLLAEVAKFGIAGVKRIYGDWTSTKHSQWKLSLLEHSISPIQQFAYTTGKNATDSALIIDAMDLMYSQRLDGFCLVSSDSDFTRLAQRLREAGMVVYGFGERKTPKPFVVACDKFVYTEVLRKDPSAVPDGSAFTQLASAPAAPVPTTSAGNGASRRGDAVAPNPTESAKIPGQPHCAGDRARCRRVRMGASRVRGELPNQGPAGFRSETLWVSQAQ